MIQAVTHIDRHTFTHTQTGRYIYRETDTFTVTCKHSQRDSRMSCKLMARMRIYVCLCCVALCCRLPLPVFPTPPRSAILRLSLGTQKMASGQVELTTYRPGGQTTLSCCVTGRVQLSSSCCRLPPVRHPRNAVDNLHKKYHKRWAILLCLPLSLSLSLSVPSAAPLSLLLFWPICKLLCPHWLQAMTLA